MSVVLFYWIFYTASANGSDQTEQNSQNKLQATEVDGHQEEGKHTH